MGPLSSSAAARSHLASSDVAFFTMKLIYFDMQGRAEFSRLLLAQAGVQYEDKRISQAEWEKLKPTMPFAELPALEVDGQTIVQSLAIARFIAKKHGLAGNGDMEAAKADMIVDGCSDFINKVVFPLHFEKDAGKKFPDVWTTVSAKAPKIAAHVEMVFALPNIKKWVET